MLNPNKIDDYVMLHTVAEGRFGPIYLGKHKKYGELSVIKQLNKAKIEASGA